MKMHMIKLSGVAVSALACVLLFGCASTPPQDPALDQAQVMYQSASNNPQAAQADPADLQKASAALDQAYALQKQGASQVDVDHYAYLASQRVAIAQQQAAAAAAQAEIKQASAQRSQIQLQASQQQAQNASAATRQAQMQAQQAQTQAQMTQQQNAQLQQQLAELKAKQTNRGMVLTLGNILFALNKADLKSGADSTIQQLAQFMQNYPKRNVMVEGYTDSTGSADYNQDLSERRADAVKTALVNDGINPQRIVTKGFGEQFPVADNSTAAGRQQNRRVEIVISDANGNFPQSR
ncbi:MAG: OmpA family protein [Gammaproteobacteria bacterium]